MNEVEAYLSKGERAFAAAGLLLAEGDADFAVSRAYYGAFYVASALLESRGLRFARHSSVISQFGMLFARPNVMDRSFHRLLDQGFKLRQLADYTTEPMPDASVVAGMIREGRRFLSESRVHLGDV